MPISVECPECRRAYHLADEMRGKKIRCKQCEHVFPVAETAPEAEIPVTLEEPGITREQRPPTAARARERGRDADAEPAGPRARIRKRRSPRDDEGGPDVRKRGGPGVGLLLGGLAGAALLLFTVCAGAGYLLLRPAPAQPPVALAPPALVPQPPGVFPGPGPGPAPGPQPRPVVAPPAPVPPPVPFPPPARPVPPAWAVRPDPGPDVLGPLKPDATVPLSPLGDILYPGRGSTFVAVGQNVTDADARHIWDLRSMTQVGTISGRLNGSSHVVLSPDGKYLAYLPTNLRECQVEVLSTQNGRVVQTLHIDDKFSAVGLLDFAGVDRVVVGRIANLKKVLQLWDVTTGKLVREMTPGSTLIDNKNNHAISPAGRYLAGADPVTNKVIFHDLQEGVLAGELTIPPAPEYSPVRGLAFSPDGSELAVFSSATAHRVVVIDVAKGGVTRVVNLPKDLLDRTSSARIYSGPGVEWLGNRGNWLVLGNYLIDNPSGGVVYTVPPELEPGFQKARRALGPNHLATVKGSGNARHLHLLTLPRGQIDLAAGAARTGKDPATASLPPTSPVDWTTARTIPPAAGAVAWAVEPDGLAARKLATRPIAVPVKGSAIDRVVFAGASSLAAVLSNEGEAGAAERKFQAHRYDLAGGEARGATPLFTVPPARPGMSPPLVADLSPDGTLLAVVEPATSRQVHIYSLAEKKHVVAYLPHEKDANVKLHWVGFLDQKRLLTNSSDGQRVLWTVPDGKAVHATTGATSSALSPGRRYVAGFAGGAVELADAATGERRGRLTAPAGINLSSCSALAFRSDGAALAGLFGTGTGFRLVCWDLQRGEPVADLPADRNTGSLSWCGPKHLQLDGTLFDLTLKAAVCLYVLPGMGKHAPGGPDGRHWYAVGQGAEGQANLTAETVPGPAVRELIDSLSKPGAQVLLRPGMKVGVSVEVVGSGATNEARAGILAAARARLATGGLEVIEGAGAPLTLRVQVNEQNTGKTRKYDSIGGGPRRVITIKVKQLNCQASLTGPAGVLWENSRTTETPNASFVRTEDLQQHFDRQLWNTAGGLGSVVAFCPTFLVRTGGRVVTLPVPAVLVGDR